MSSEFWATAFEHPFGGQPVLKHLPKSVRSLCGAYLASLLRKICTSSEDLNFWAALFNFGYKFLAKPSVLDKGHNLASIIRKHFTQDEDDNNIECVKPAFNSKSNKGSSSLANLIASKMEDGNVTAAIRLLIVKTSQYTTLKKLLN